MSKTNKKIITKRICKFEEHDLFYPIIPTILRKMYNATARYTNVRLTSISCPTGFAILGDRLETDTECSKRIQDIEKYRLRHQKLCEKWQQKHSMKLVSKFQSIKKQLIKKGISV